MLRHAECSSEKTISIDCSSQKLFTCVVCSTLREHSIGLMWMSLGPVWAFRTASRRNDVLTLQIGSLDNAGLFPCTAACCELFFIKRTLEVVRRCSALLNLHEHSVGKTQGRSHRGVQGSHGRPTFHEKNITTIMKNKKRNSLSFEAGTPCTISSHNATTRPRRCISSPRRV